MLPIGLNQGEKSRLRGIVDNAMSRGVGSFGSFSPFALLGSLGSGLMTNITNAILNKQNNRAQQAESEKAYQRSLPSNQVNNLMNAGMSRAGALSSLSGGGTYTPAPQIATEIDTSTIQSVLGSVAQQELQAKHAERLADKQLQIERDKHRLERDKFEYEKKRTTHNDAYDNIIKTFQAAKINSEAQSANLDWLVKEFTHNERIDSEKQKLIAEKAKSLADELQSKLYKGALEDVDEETLKSLFKYQAVLEMLGNIGHMTTEKAIQIIHDVKEILIPG